MMWALLKDKVQVWYEGEIAPGARVGEIFVEE